MKATEQYFPAVLQWLIQGRGPLPPPPLLILDQTDAQRAEKKFKTALPLPQPPSFFSGSGWPGPLLIWRSWSATALFIIPYEWVLTGMTGRSARVWPSWLQLPSAFIFFFVLFIILWERVLTFEFVHADEIWKCNHSDKSNYRLALSVIVRYKMILTFDSWNKILPCGHLNETSCWVMLSCSCARWS